MAILDQREALNVLAKETARRFERQSVGEQTFTVGSGAAVALTVPANAITAELQVVDGGSTDPRKSISFLCSGTTATSSNGIILGDLSLYEIIGATVLSNFSCIGIQGSITHTVHVIYYR